MIRSTHSSKQKLLAPAVLTKVILSRHIFIESFSKQHQTGGAELTKLCYQKMTYRYM
jgi:citrate lyase alpha subunit